MNFYEGFIFFASLGIAIVPAIILGILGRPLGLYSGFLSFIFLYLIFRDTPKQMWFIVGYACYICVLIKMYMLIRNKKGKQKLTYYMVIILAITPLALSKLADLFGIQGIGFVGISYITFRALQIIIESYDGVIKKMPLLELISFLLFFPSFSSGPIDRSRRFQEDFNKKLGAKEYLDLLGSGLYKIVLGLGYKFILSAIAYDYLNTFFASKTEVLYVIGYAYCYGFYLFFDFAGYSLMAIGTGNLLGFRLPDNFKLPFLSKNISDFWNRWHISLSHWFRDFLFSRLMMNAIRGKWFNSKLTGACICFIINMTIMGVWHGLSLSYIGYGLYHGILLAANEIWQRKSRVYKKYKKNKVYIAISWFVTINMVMLGFLIFSGRFAELLLLLIQRI